MGMREGEGERRNQLLGNLGLTIESLAVPLLSYTGVSYGVGSQLPLPTGPPIFPLRLGKEERDYCKTLKYWSGVAITAAS